MTELLPCPFCGGRQTYRKHDGGVWLTTTNHKRGCIMRDALAFVAYRTEAEAIEAWNSRAEMDYEDALILLDELGVSERTCRNTSDSNYFRCSVCRKKTYRGEETFNYCPNCGAKVVGK